jgi:hypothetical protein
MQARGSRILRLGRKIPLLAASSWRATHSAKAPSVRGKELLFIGALWRNCALIGVLGGSQNRRHTGALKPVGEPDSFGIAVKALAKSRIRIRSYPDQKID